MWPVAEADGKPGMLAHGGAGGGLLACHFKGRLGLRNEDHMLAVPFEAMVAYAGGVDEFLGEIENF